MKGGSLAGILGCLLFTATAASAQSQSNEWSIVDNSFLVEEAFNQERGIFQNIFTWTRARSGAWSGTFTQEWPVPAMRHQFSYTVPFSRENGVGGLNDVLLNYRLQLAEGNNGGVAVSPRLSLIVPTGSEQNGLGSGRAGLQWNVPASKQFGDVYVHANTGMTWVPDVERVTTVAGSGIWKATPMFNLMIEAVAELNEAFTISPGFRRGWGDERQVVIGFAVPVTWSDGTSRAAVLTYFSYELPFRKLH